MTPNTLISGLQAHLAWAPPWTLGVAVALIALVIVQLGYDVLVRLVRRTLRRRDAFWRSLVTRTRGPGRLALILAAMSWSVEAAPFPPRPSALIQHGLGVLAIVLAGWVVLTGLDIAAALYLRRFRMDVADNLAARKHLTQVRILRRAVATLVVLLTAGLALMTVPAIRQLGVSLLAAGGAAGIIVGLALQPILSNLMAGVQIALTQPIRLDDAVVIEGQFGNIEEINSTYVVVRLWDQRRMVAPLKYFLDQPFENWTRRSAELVGTVLLYLDYSVPTAPLRAKLSEILEASPLWDRKVSALQVTDARERTLEVRCLVSARNSGELFELRCEVREKLVAWLQAEFAAALPRERLELQASDLGFETSASRTGPGRERVQ